MDAIKWNKGFGGNDRVGSDKFWKRNGRLQAFLNENLKSSSSEQNDSDFSFGGKHQDGNLKAPHVTTNVHVHLHSGSDKKLPSEQFKSLEHM
jgi:hypothetical protein